MKYADKLKDPRWQKLRLAVFDRDKWTCLKCGEQVKTLHVHHLSYAASGDPWDTPIGDLETLCCDCHDWREGLNKAMRDSIRGTSTKRAVLLCESLNAYFDAGGVFPMDLWIEALAIKTKELIASK